jgi:hypothetical protein
MIAKLNRYWIGQPERVYFFCETDLKGLYNASRTYWTVGYSDFRCRQVFAHCWLMNKIILRIIQTGHWETLLISQKFKTPHTVLWTEMFFSKRSHVGHFNVRNCTLISQMQICTPRKTLQKMGLSQSFCFRKSFLNNLIRVRFVVRAIFYFCII